MKDLHIAGIVVGVLIVAGVVAYLFLAPAPQLPTTNNELPTTPAKRQVPEGWREYQHPVRHFSLLYPDVLELEEEPIGGAVALSFQVAGGGYGFQIFVVPYAETEISEERFAQDIPSGVRTEVTPTTVAGVDAVRFYSTDTQIGETVEVWFIKDGYLYEVTTYKEMQADMQEILQTWEFK